jgi:branched-chain amino acid transport system substrate-binding protein
MKLKAFIYLLLSLVLSGCLLEESLPATNGKTQTILFTLPMTGSSNLWSQRTVQRFKDTINQMQRLPKGTNLQVLVMDLSNDPDIAIQQWQKLDTELIPEVIVSFNNSDTVLAIKPMIEVLGIPLLAAMATHSDVPKNSQYINQFVFDDLFQGRVGAMFLHHELFAEKVAIINSENSRYAKDLSSHFKHAFIELGGEISSQHIIPEQSIEKDYQRLSQVLKHEAPDIIYMPLKTKHTVRMARALKEAGSNARIFVTDGALALLSNEHNEQLGALENMIISDVYSPDLPDLRLTRASKWLQDIDPKMEDGFTILAAEAAVMLYKVLTHCETRADTSACIAQQIRNTKDINGLVGLIGMTNEGKAERPLFINEFKNGKINLLVRVY